MHFWVHIGEILRNNMYMNANHSQLQKKDVCSWIVILLDYTWEGKQSNQEELLPY